MRNVEYDRLFIHSCIVVVIFDCVSQKNSELKIQNASRSSMNVLLNCKKNAVNIFNKLNILN